MKRVKVLVSYNGTKFCGFQRQPKDRTIQGEIEKALTKMHKFNIEIHASGRTDASVHAIGQVFHFDTNLNITEYGIIKGLNSLLPNDIYIRNAEFVNDDFHARYSATTKEYYYLLSTRDYNPIEKDIIYQYGKNLDVEAMREASSYLLGTHDYSAFCHMRKNYVRNKVRRIDSINIVEVDSMVKFTFKGSGFLKYMVRILIGTLILVGEHEINPEVIKEILESKDRNMAGKTAPGCGLYLSEVRYDN